MLPIIYFVGTKCLRIMNIFKAFILMENYPCICTLSKPWSCPDRALYLLQLFSSHTATGHRLRISLRALYRLAKQPQSWKFQSVKWQFDATAEQLKKKAGDYNELFFETGVTKNAHSFGSLQEWNKSVEKEIPACICHRFHRPQRRGLKQQQWFCFKVQNGWKPMHDTEEEP